ncbi:Protocadherin-16 [Globodera pallida]|nr:Protocadherin-16 [Globodera pallida]
MLLLLFFLHLPSCSSQRPSTPYAEQSLHVQLVEECPLGSPVFRLPPLPPSFSPWHISASPHSQLVPLNVSSGTLLVAGRIDRESLPVDANNGKCLLHFVFVSRAIGSGRLASSTSRTTTLAASSSSSFPPSSSSSSFLNASTKPSNALTSSFRLIRLTVEVLDVNDNAPTFGVDPLSLSISESASPGSRFSLGRARDADAGDNGTIGGCELLPPVEASLTQNEDISALFRAEKGPAGDFVLELRDGQLDRERTAQLHGQMKVWDVGTPRMEAIVELYIRLLDANDNAPCFERALYTVTLDPNYKMSSDKVSVGKVSATDADEGVNGQVRYELSERTGAIEVDERTGELFISRRRAESVCPPKGDSNSLSDCTFVVNAIDGGMPPLSAKATVVVQFAKGVGPKVASNETGEKKHPGRRDDRLQGRLRIKNLPSGLPFASLNANTPNGTVVSVVTMENVGEEEAIDFGLKGSEGLFRLEQIRNGLALLRLNGTVENDGDARQWTVEIAGKRSDGRQIGPSERVQIFLRHASDGPAPLPLPALQTVRLPEDLPVGSLIARLNASSSAPSSPYSPTFTFRLASPEWEQFIQVHPVAGLLRLRQRLPPLREGEAMRQLAVKVELARDPPTLSAEEHSAQAEVRIEVFDVNDHFPLIAGCPPKSLPCVLSLHLLEDQPLWTPFLTVNATDPDSGPNALLSFALRPFGADLNSVSLFAIDVHRGNISLRRSLDFEQWQDHRLWVEVKDGGTPSRKVKALLEVFVEDANDKVPQFASPEATFLSLRLSQPAHSVLLSVSASDSDSDDQALGLRYSILERDRSTSPLGMFQMSEDQLILAKSPAAIGLHENDHFMLQIGAMDCANHSAPSPLNVHVRIVSDLAKVPPKMVAILRPPLEDKMGNCWTEGDILKALAFPPGDDGLRVANLTLFRGEPSELAIRSNPISLCIRTSSSASALSSSRSVSHFVLADLGLDGWTLIKIMRRPIPSAGLPRLIFLDAAPNITMIGLSSCQIRFRLEGDRWDGLLGLHPTEGLLSLARDDVEWATSKDGTEVRAIAQLADGKAAVEQKFWLRIERKAFGEGAENFFHFPPSLTLFVPDEPPPRPGDLLANLARFSPLPNPCKLRFVLQMSENWWPNSSSNWAATELVTLLPDGEIRLLKEPPFGLTIWEREVKAAPQQPFDGPPIGERIVRVRLLIRRRSLRPVHSPLQCPDTPKTFRWPSNAPSGTLLGILEHNFAGGAEQIKRFQLLNLLELFMVDELNGKLRIRSTEVGTDRGRHLDLRYRISEVGAASRKACGMLNCLKSPCGERRELAGEESFEESSANARRSSNFKSGWKLPRWNSFCQTKRRSS